MKFIQLFIYKFIHSFSLSLSLSLSHTHTQKKKKQRCTISYQSVKNLLNRRGEEGRQQQRTVRLSLVPFFFFFFKLVWHTHTATYNHRVAPLSLRHLARHSPVILTPLPKPPGKSFNVAHHFLFVREVHLPYQRTVAENPHFIATGVVMKAKQREGQHDFQIAAYNVT